MKPFNRILLNPHQVILLLLVLITLNSCKLDLENVPHPCMTLTDTATGHYNTPYMNTNLIFDGTCSTKYDELEWDFGDGSAHQKGTIVTHLYSYSGNITMTLTARKNYDSTIRKYLITIHPK